MKRIVTIWLLTFVLTVAFLVWQKVSGPTYEKTGQFDVGTGAMDYELLRTHSITGDLPVTIVVAEAGSPDPGIQGTVIWRRYPTDEPWQRLPMRYEDGLLKAELPRQPMAGKLEYEVELVHGQVKELIPGREAAVARFKGDVPGLVLVFHVTCMVLGMLFSTGAGLDALTGGSASLKPLSRVTFAFLLLGGLILGPVVQKYAFDAYWTGWPLGEDWTDNKLAVGALVWALAMWRTSRAEPGRPAGKWWVVAAMVTILIIYSIPHSIHGSTFDYETGEHIQAYASWSRALLPG
ncbi:MAG: hypothetical protein GY838_07565 [bacterium]|nr:hypothetical protein [bacterium]